MRPLLSRLPRSSPLGLRRYNAAANWQEKYADRVMKPEEAVRYVRSHSRVFLTGNCGVPKQLLSALVGHAPQL